MSAFPENDLERRLLEASQGRLELGDWLADLAAAQVWVPLQSSDGSTGTFPVLSIDGGSYVPVFTSQTQVDKAAPDNPRVHPPVAELVASLPETVGLAVNPGGEVGLPVPAAPLREALGLPSTVGAGTTLRIGDPAEEPVALLDELSTAFESLPMVRSARRAWAVVGENRPGLVVGLDVDPDNSESRAAALAAVRSVVAGRPDDFSVDVVFDNDRSAFVEWMHAHTTPFFGGAPG